ncbi:MAG: nitroreductase [Gammaproteobacteria bacterium]|nr:nitroreductase [Gammaproteobacteria bacterium]MDH4314013.1 nitroreductase [Gammaproteobacteria bacterium]MDH5214931.1 nitroreductase [Gammaproteobacteria bacterium]MDH5499764.1 nitroreductase [Gammaproteobacteria bacterium]
MMRSTVKVEAGLQRLAERIRGRRTTNLFLKQKVSRKLIREAIELARWAPNHHLTEPWHFHVLGPQAIAHSIELIRDNAAKKKDAAFGEFKAQAAGAIPGWLVVTCRKSDDEICQREDYASCCCAIQNLMLYLSEAGVASKWTTGAITLDERLFSILGSSSADNFVVGLIWYGYPKVLPTQTRKDLAQIMSELP